MTDPVVSPTGIIHVLGYTPQEGEPGVPITVRIHFHPDLADAMYVRLVVDNKAVPTKVRLLPGVIYGRWQLHAATPALDPTSATPQHQKVLLSVQALNEDNAILDTVTFGEFSYWHSNQQGNGVQRRRLPRLQIPDQTGSGRRQQQLPTPSTSPAGSGPHRSPRLHRRLKSQIVRAKHGDYPQTPVLDMITPLGSLCHDWAPEENAAGRRLVRFTKVQDGRKLIVSCEPVLQEAYNDTDTVISCIFREDSRTCYVTSVDVIYLLERLTNGEFPVEEKNRIRRNLEGLRPTTISKHKPGFGEFFQRIMDFPDPKPRNIEKDLKVFDWNLLGQALEKILSKYSIYTAPADSTPSASNNSSSLDVDLDIDPALGVEDLPGLGDVSPDSVASSSSASSSPVFAPDASITSLANPSGVVWAQNVAGGDLTKDPSDPFNLLDTSASFGHPSAMSMGGDPHAVNTLHLNHHHSHHHHDSTSIMDHQPMYYDPFEDALALVPPEYSM